MSRLPSTGPSLQRWLRQQERKAQRQQQSSAFARSGTSVTAEGVVTVDGELDINGPLAVHGTADFDGDTTIGGNAAITGTLSLPAGIIDNAALASPVKPQSVYFSAPNFAVSTTPSAKASSTFTVPAGFTSAVVSVNSRIYAINPNTTGGWDSAGADFLYAESKIGADNGTAMPLMVAGSNYSGINFSPFSTVLTGLTGGGTFTITVVASTMYQTWAANTSNAAEVSGSILWFR